MKIGIRSIKYIAAHRVIDYSYLPAAARMNFNACIMEGSLKDLPFTPETADVSEMWEEDDRGRYSIYSLKASVRGRKEEHRSTINQLVGMNHIFLVELLDGTKTVVGSRQFLPTFKATDSLSGNSKSEFNIQIDLRSLHGVLFSID